MNTNYLPNGVIAHSITLSGPDDGFAQISGLIAHLIERRMTEKSRDKGPLPENRLFNFTCESILNAGFELNIDSFLEWFNDPEANGIHDRIGDRRDPLNIRFTVFHRSKIVLEVPRDVQLSRGKLRGKRVTWDRNSISDKISIFKKSYDSERQKSVDKESTESPTDTVAIDESKARFTDRSFYISNLGVGFETLSE